MTVLPVPRIFCHEAEVQAGTESTVCLTHSFASRFFLKAGPAFVVARLPTTLPWPSIGMPRRVRAQDWPQN